MHSEFREKLTANLQQMIYKLLWQHVKNKVDNNCSLLCIAHWYANIIVLGANMIHHDTSWDNQHKDKSWDIDTCKRHGNLCTKIDRKTPWDKSGAHINKVLL